MNGIVKTFYKVMTPIKLRRFLRLKRREIEFSTLTAESAVTFQEKIKLRIKLSADPSIGKKMAFYADKYAVREYVKQKIGEQYLIPLLHVTEQLTLDIWESLPSQFVVKTNFGTGSSHFHIVKDKNKESFSLLQQKFDKAMKDDWYKKTLEMAYSFIDRKIIIEAYLPGVDGLTSPDDYKLHCFKSANCEDVEVVTQVVRGRFKSISKNFYDDNDVLLDMNYGGTPNFALELPAKLSEMKRLSKILLGDLTYARIDWYLVNDKIFFGEITHTHTAGCVVFTPAEVNKTFAAKIKHDNVFDNSY